MSAPIIGPSVASDSPAKRVLDIVAGGAALFLSTPFWVAIGLAVLLEDGWPVLYPQRRVGKGGRLFTAYKFRSMIRDAEKVTGPVLATTDDPRITRVGRLLRKMALDEIPQLLGIFKGDMSWVGPRPERPEFVADLVRSIPGYHDRHAIRPGLTGLAQVYGRYHTDPAEKLKYDLYYIKHHSLLMDFRLFVQSWLITFKAKWDATTESR
jgi:lipopolysaccharide/colanic/teichoic acid biosynthesis glycosyltransferase